MGSITLDSLSIHTLQSYNWLRKSANLILNLLSLMGDAGINDISKRSDLPKVLMKVEEKFRLDLTGQSGACYECDVVVVAHTGCTVARLAAEGLRPMCWRSVAHC